MMDIKSYFIVIGLIVMIIGSGVYQFRRCKFDTSYEKKKAAVKALRDGDHILIEYEGKRYTAYFIKRNKYTITVNLKHEVVDVLISDYIKRIGD